MRIQSAVLCLVLCVAAPIAGVAAASPASSSPPRAVTTPAPDYAEAERRAGHAGEVQVAFRVAADGTVADVRVAHSSGWPVLDASALEAARRWRFEPARDSAGKPVAAQVQMPITFDATAQVAAADPVAAARATSCATFLTEVYAYRMAGDPTGGGHFATVWGALMDEYRAKYGASAALAKVPTSRRVFDNTVLSCRRAPSRPLGSAVEREFYQVR
jgi:protein TonB